MTILERLKIKCYIILNMNTIKLCSPALIYLIFSLTQIIVDTSKKLYNVALVKFVMMILFTLLLNILCERGLGVISWIIVFVPFVLMSVITSILLFVFGLDPSSGNIIKANYNTSLGKDSDRMEHHDPRPHRDVPTHASVKHSPKHHVSQHKESAHKSAHAHESAHAHAKHHHPHSHESTHKKDNEPRPHDSRPQHTKHHKAEHTEHAKHD
jgi:hypothetical protein